MKLEPGWLMRTCHDAHIRTMLNSSPSYALAYSIQTPIPDDEAADLYAMMSARFEAWTGLSLKDFERRMVA